MGQMNASITDQLAGYVRKKVKSGRYNNCKRSRPRSVAAHGKRGRARIARGKAYRGRHPYGPYGETA